VAPKRSSPCAGEHEVREEGERADGGNTLVDENLGRRVSRIALEVETCRKPPGSSDFNRQG